MQRLEPLQVKVIGCMFDWQQAAKDSPDYAFLQSFKAVALVPVRGSVSARSLRTGFVLPGICSMYASLRLGHVLALLFILPSRLLCILMPRQTPICTKKAEPVPSAEGAAKRSVSDEAMASILRLVHGSDSTKVCWVCLLAASAKRRRDTAFPGTDGTQANIEQLEEYKTPHRELPTTFTHSLSPFCASSLQEAMITALYDELREAHPQLTKNVIRTTLATVAVKEKRDNMPSRWYMQTLGLPAYALP